MRDQNEVEHLAITGDDLKWASRQNRWACAIVRSIQRQLPEATFVRADKEKIAYSIDGHRYVHPTPPIAIQRVIEPLDKGEVVKPTAFDLPPAKVTQVQRMTAEQKQHVRKVRRGETARKGPGKKAGVGTQSHDRFCE